MNTQPIPKGFFIVVGILALASFALLRPPSPNMARISKAWAACRCDLCDKPLTADVGDGLYWLEGKEQFLHKACSVKGPK